MPKNDHRYHWTLHSRGKLFQYNLTPNVVKRVIRHPDRVEEGIAPKTIAVMKRKDTAKQKRELWTMYQQVGKKKRIISAWIYPGESPKGKEIYVPEDVWAELEEMGLLNEKEHQKQRAEA